MLNKRSEIKNKKSKKEESAMNIEHIGNENDFQEVTFDFLEPDNKFYLNLTQLLRKTFYFVHWNFDFLLQQICLQKDYGIFLGIEDEENPGNDMIYAVLTVINFKKLIETGFLESLKDFILDNSEGDIVDFLEHNVFSDFPSAGLLINERVLNLPYMLVPSVYDQLMEDLKYINDGGVSEEEKADYLFKFLIYFTLGIYKKEGDHVTDFSVNNLMFSKKEDEYFIKKALFVQKLPTKLGEEYCLICIVLKNDDFLQFALKGE